LTGKGLERWNRMGCTAGGTIAFQILSSLHVAFRSQKDLFITGKATG